MKSSTRKIFAKILNLCLNIKKNMSIKNQKENFLRKTPPLSGKEDLDSYNFSLFFYKKIISM